MDGIFLIDKPENISSFDVIRILKKKLNIDKIGHAGTLDPFASGLLVILVGKATKLSDILIQEDKIYETTFSFGIHTNTYDKTGTILHQNDVIPEIEDIKEALHQMSSYEQEPPMFSALKVNGKKLYELARQDITIEREKRHVDIYSCDITSYIYPDISMSLQVSKGTYIRSIAVDLARSLNTFAHVKTLRRLKSGIFSIENSKNLDTLTPNNLIPLETLLSTYPKIVVSDYIVSKIKDGLTLDQRQYNEHHMFVVCNQKGDMVALYKPFEDGQYKPMIVLA
jgi:tRNA pseudouridine55 synthase